MLSTLSVVVRELCLIFVGLEQEKIIETCPEIQKVKPVCQFSMI